MNMIHINKNSIKYKLILITMTISLCTAILFTSSCFYIFQTVLKQDLRKSTDFNLQLVTSNIHKQISELNQLAKWCGSSILIARYFESNDYDIRPALLNAFQRFQEEYYNCQAKEYLRRLVVFSYDNPERVLQIVKSFSDSHADPSHVIQDSKLFNNCIEKRESTFFTYGQTPFNQTKQDYVIALFRPVFSTHDTRIIGCVYIEIYPNIITDFFEQYTHPKDSNTYITIDQINYSIQDGILKYDTIESPESFVTQKIGIKDWAVTQTLSSMQFEQQKRTYIYFLSLIVLVLLLIGSGFTIYLNKTITRPIQLLRNKIIRISKGDFSIDQSIEWDHEIGDIGRGVNIMSKEINMLMDKRLTDEKTKTDLAYQVLLNQVNPHFMYNTLNCIKWMATIQKAEGIAEMTTSLARLLKSVSKGTAKYITLREEFDLLNDYFNILQYRYGGTIKLEYDIKDNILYDCMILKFTLQPLVENAIFHGIEPKQQSGHILIKGSIVNETTYQLEIIDNGVGMSTEMIEHVLSKREDHTSDLFKEVGIYNVDQRIKFELGNQYGIQIISELGEYTNMTLLLPFRTEVYV